jgi:hypothetical protein
MHPEAEVVVSAPVCEGLGSGCSRSEAWRELTVYAYLWYPPNGAEPRLGLVSDPRYLPRESGAEAICAEPSPAELKEAEARHERLEPHECAAGAEWRKDVAATAPVLTGRATWTINGVPLNEPEG